MAGAFLPKYGGYLGTNVIHVNNNATEISRTALCSLISPLVVKNSADLTKLANVTVAGTGITTISGPDAVTLPAASPLDIANVTASTTRLTGAMTVAGGIGITKNLTTPLLKFNPAVAPAAAQTDLSIFSESVSSGLQWTGPFTANIDGVVYLSRLGDMVSIHAPFVSGAATVAGQSVTSTVAVPASFRPANDNDVIGPCNVLSGGVTVTGSWTLHASGILEVWAGPAPTDFFAATGADDGVRFAGCYYLY